MANRRQLRSGAALFIVGAFLALSRCSLSSYPRQLTLRIDPASLQSGSGKSRSGPLISAFQYYALSVAGPIADSILTADVGNRSPSCLYLGGLTKFPLTYEQLTQTGVDLSLSNGSYSFSVVGFHNSPISGATTIGQVMTAATLPEEYLLAQATVDTTTGSNVLLTASYSGATPDRLPSCPPKTNSYDLFDTYEGRSGIAGSTPAFYPNEGGFPPKSVGGIPMSSNHPLVGIHNWVPATNDHVAISPVFVAPAGNTSDFQKVVFEVIGSGGTPSYNSGSGTCAATGYVDAALKLAVWNFNSNQWITGSPVTNGNKVSLTFDIVAGDIYMSGGKIVATIRANAPATAPTICSSLQIDSARLFFIPNSGP